MRYQNVITDNIPAVNKSTKYVRNILMYIFVIKGFFMINISQQILNPRAMSHTNQKGQNTSKYPRDSIS